MIPLYTHLHSQSCHTWTSRWHRFSWWLCPYPWVILVGSLGFVLLWNVPVFHISCRWSWNSHNAFVNLVCAFSGVARTVSEQHLFTNLSPPPDKILDPLLYRGQQIWELVLESCMSRHPGLAGNWLAFWNIFVLNTSCSVRMQNVYLQNMTIADSRAAEY